MNSKVQSIMNKIKGFNTAKQLSGMMIVTMITQVIAVYKSSIIAANFGAGVELDAYNFSNNLATFFLTFISAGITTVVIPAYVKKLDRKAIDTFLTVVFSATGILMLATFLLRGQIVDVFTNREPAFREYVTGIMMLTIWIQLLPAILGVTTAYYQCIDRFTLPKVILLISNVITVAILVIMKDFSLYEYLYILLLGAVIQFVVDLICAVKCGFRFKISFDIHNPVYKDIMKLFLPTLFSSGIYKINTMIDSLLSSNLGAGQLTILSYANTIVGMINMLIIGNLITYVYPKIVVTIDKGKEYSQKALWKYAVVFHMAVCLIIVGFISVGREFIGLLYEHGEFTSRAADSVYFCMCIYTFAQQNNIVRDILYRYFFANADTKTTVRNGLVTSFLNIVLSITLVQFLDVYGIIIGTFIAGLCSLIMITVRFKHKFGFAIKMKPIVFAFIKTELAVAASVGVVLVSKTFIPDMNYFFEFLIYGCMCVGVYTILILIMHGRSKLLRKQN